MAIGTQLVVSFDAKQVQRGLDGITKSFKSIGSGLAKVGGVTAGLAALGAAGAGALAAVAININAIGEAARASDARVQNIVASMGIFGDKSAEVSDRLLNFADTQGRALGIDDDIIASTEAKLMTFKELAKSADTAGGAFDRATMAALDMAKAGFGEAEQNAVQLGKALNDPIKGVSALSKSGITFSEAQKQMIASMVEMGEMGKAQNIVLSAIEQQVGGTAAATATASEKIKVSLSQVLEEFAKPFSEGFNGLPGALEAVFPKIIEKAGQLGNEVSSAISASIKGDHDKLVAVGNSMGDAMMIGLETSFQFTGGKLFKTFLDKRSKFKDPMGLLAGFVSNQIGEPASAGDLFAAAVANNRKPDAPDEYVPWQPSMVPGSNGRFRYAAPNEASSLNDGNGNKVVEVLKNIEKNTQSGAKM